jgi:hypothetical protein
MFWFGFALIRACTPRRRHRCGRPRPAPPELTPRAALLLIAGGLGVVALTCGGIEVANVLSGVIPLAAAWPWLLIALGTGIGCVAPVWWWAFPAERHQFPPMPPLPPFIPPPPPDQPQAFYSDRR